MSRESDSAKVLSPVDPEGPGCAAAVAHEGDIVWSGSRGMADLATGAALTPSTIFDIGSVSKQFTAAAILLLAAEGRLSLNDVLARHLPETPPWAAAVTLQEMMHLTSGIPDYGPILLGAAYEQADTGEDWSWRVFEGDVTNAHTIDLLASADSLDFAPGSSWAYSSSNYVLLGEVVAAVSGRSLADYVKRRIFDPLQLDMVIDPIGDIAGKAVPYEERRGIGFVPLRSGWQQVGDGVVHTTPVELARWGDNYRTGEVGGRGLLRAQLDDAALTSSPEHPPGTRYGAGIFLHPDGQLFHDGDWLGFHTFFLVTLDRRTSVAVTCNSATYPAEDIANELARIWR